MRVNETSARKKAIARHHPYRKGEFKARGKEDEFCSKFHISYKELISIPTVAKKLRFPQKADKNLGGRKDIWCKFHKGFRHDIERCMALGYQLAKLLKDGFLKEYLEVDQGEPQKEVVLKDQAHEVPVHVELNMIFDGFSGGGNTTTKRKRYTRAVMSLEAIDHDDTTELDLNFMKADLVGVVPHDNDPVVIFVVMIGRKVHRVLIDQGSSANVLFWSMFLKFSIHSFLLLSFLSILFISFTVCFLQFFFYRFFVFSLLCFLQLMQLFRVFCSQFFVFIFSVDSIHVFYSLFFAF